jgi:TRAP-type uncharacterized transport system fused permease subunit
VPFYIIYTPDIMLVSGNPLKAAIAILMAIVGIWALAGSACGYVFRELRFYERLMLFICIPLTIPNKPLWNITGAGIISLITVYIWLSKKRAERKGYTIV